MSWMKFFGFPVSDTDFNLHRVEKEQEDLRLNKKGVFNYIINNNLKPNKFHAGMHLEKKEKEHIIDIL